MAQILVFMGPPGAGKGSLSQQCLQRYDWYQLSTGALCRKHIIEKSSIGLKIAFAIQSGKLIPDDLMISMVKEWFRDNIDTKKSIILDGFPRTICQAELLVDLVQQELPHYTLKIVKLAVADEIVIHRLAGRAICENKDCQAVYSVYSRSTLGPKVDMVCDMCKAHLIRRADDERPSERLEIYHKSATQLVEFYHRAGIKVCEIDVDRLPEHIFYDFDQMLGHALV